MATDRLKVGTRVYGPEGAGVIRAHCSKHDVFVELDNGGSALYCQERTCREYEPVYQLPKGESLKRPTTAKVGSLRKFLRNFLHLA